MQTTSGMMEILHGRHNPGIDPALHIWGWEISVYLFLGGLAAGILILSAALEMRAKTRPEALRLRVMPLVALVILSAGMVALLADLEYKIHFWRFYLAFEPRSPMSWGSWILLIVYPVGLLLGLGALTGEERRGLARFPLVRPFGGLLRRAAAFSDRRRRGILVAAVAAGALLGAYTGLLLGTLGARPAWNTTILGPLFLLSGLSTGAAFMLLFRPPEEERHVLVRWDMALIGAEFLFIILMILDLATGDRARQAAAGALLGGPYTGVFWALVVVTGLAVPLALESVETRRSVSPTLLAPALVLIGGLSLRWILLAAGQASSHGLLP
ncbi:MAG: NrfD/PsrC family molybdoenzyme membrane anchor subunit [Candidatus Eisenbacteria bacterium]